MCECLLFSEIHEKTKTKKQKYETLPRIYYRSHTRKQKIERTNARPLSQTKRPNGNFVWFGRFFFFFLRMLSIHRWKFCIFFFLEHLKVISIHMLDDHFYVAFNSVTQCIEFRVGKMTLVDPIPWLRITIWEHTSIYLLSNIENPTVLTKLKRDDYITFVYLSRVIQSWVSFSFGDAFSWTLIQSKCRSSHLVVGRST